eukprot:contig_13478_g3231
MNVISCKYEAELLTAFGETFCPSERARATGVPVACDDIRGSFAFPPGEDADVILLPPRSSASKLLSPELEHLKTALGLEGVLNVPEIILAKKYARLQLSCGTIAGSGVGAGGIKRRNNLLQINSED